MIDSAFLRMLRSRMARSTFSGSGSPAFQRVTWNSRRKAGSVSGVVPSNRIGKIGRRFASSCGAIQRHLRLGADPAPHPVATDQHNEGAAALHYRLQPVEPDVSRLKAFIVLEHVQLVPPELRVEIGGRNRIVAAVAEKNVIDVRHRVAAPEPCRFVSTS